MITTKENVAYFKQMAASKFTLTPDTQSVAMKKPKFKIVQNRETFSDGQRQLELIPIYSSITTSETIYYYLPKEKILIGPGGFEGTYYSEKDVSDNKEH